MKQVSLVTDGEISAAILAELLPKSVTETTEIVWGTGVYSAQSLASSILVMEQIPVGLVVDSASQDGLAIAERTEILNEALGRVSPGIRFEVFLVVPEIEVLFFQEREVIEKLIDRSLSDIEWELAKSRPRDFLRLVNKEPKNILDSLDPQEIEKIRNHPLIADIAQFLATDVEATLEATDSAVAMTGTGPYSAEARIQSQPQQTDSEILRRLAEFGERFENRLQEALGAFEKRHLATEYVRQAAWTKLSTRMSAAMAENRQDEVLRLRDSLFRLQTALQQILSTDQSLIFTGLGTLRQLTEEKVIPVGALGELFLVLKRQGRFNPHNEQIVDQIGGSLGSQSRDDLKARDASWTD